MNKHICIECTTTSRIARSEGMQMFSVSRYCRTIFQNGCLMHIPTSDA